VVPLRAGSGTRVKVLEGFACRVPVVSTSLGCEGLEVVAGQHLLVADDAPAFAAACIRLLTDSQLRDAIVREARSLFESRYRWEDVQLSIRRMVLSLLDDGASAATRPA
jgi:glycosyltransferase involved in cell wall biosynthesis